MQKTFADIIEAMGGKRARQGRRPTARRRSQPGGYIIHEVGGAIMGADPKKSVVNQWRPDAGT